MSTRAPSAAVLAARSRWAGSSAAGAVRWEWFTKNVVNKVNLTMNERVKIATELLKSKITQNLSTAVTVGVGPKGGRVVTNRSKPGEYPHAETATLLRGIFSVVQQNIDGSSEGFVGTPHDYGLILETKLNRSFLVRTLNEEANNLGLVLTAPMKD